MQSSKSGITASGATAVSVLLKRSDDGKDQTLYVGNVGDSRAILVTSKPINEWVFHITPSCCEVHPPPYLLLSCYLLLSSKPLSSEPLSSSEAPKICTARPQIRLTNSLWIPCQKTDVRSQSRGRGGGTKDQRSRWIRYKRQASTRTRRCGWNMKYLVSRQQHALCVL